MRIIVDKANLKGTVVWLRENDERFGAYDEAQATEKLVESLKRSVEPVSLEQADTDQFTCIVWQGVMASVAAGGGHGRPDDAREVTLWCCHQTGSLGYEVIG